VAAESSSTDRLDGILPLAFRAEELDCRAIVRYTNCEMDVASVERLLVKGGSVVNDQGHMLRNAELKPGTRKTEPWPRDLFKGQDPG
jgi:hypothetical protein